METVAATFTSAAAATASVRCVRERGVSADDILLLFPGDDVAALDLIPTNETESSGLGKAIGGVVGGGAGIAAGLSIVVPLLLPGAAVAAIIGVAAATTAGVVSGATVGDALERALGGGVPVDDTYVYEDALRKGRAVLFVRVRDDSEVDDVTDILARNGAESINAARAETWAGLRSAEEREYEKG